MLGAGLKKVFILLFMIHAVFLSGQAQSVSFELKTSPSLHFDFNTIQKYLSGITVMNACELKINAVGTQWDLYVGATTAVAGLWDVHSVYSVSGEVPPIDILQLQFRNASMTSNFKGFFPIRDILSPTYIIGSALPDAGINCPVRGANQPGNYLASPSCCRFNVDLKITPGFKYQAGSYSIRIDYLIVQDL